MPAGVSTVTLTVGEPGGDLALWTLDGARTLPRAIGRGEFPQWRKLMPTHDSGEWGAFGVNPTYLAGVMAAAKIVGERNAPARVTPGATPAKPLTVTAQRNGLAMTALVMPVRLPD